MIVLVREVWIQPYRVEGVESEEEAIKLVKSNDRRAVLLDGAMEFSHQLSTDTWTVDTE